MAVEKKTVERSITKLTYPSGTVTYLVDKRFGRHGSEGRHRATFKTLEEARAYLKKSIKQQHRDRKWKSYVYFIKNIDTGHIKIGKAADPKSRFYQVYGKLKTHRELYGDASPNLKMLGWIKQSTRVNEDQLHLRFKEKRVAGEWFCPSIEEEVKELLEKSKSFNFDS